MTVQPWLAPKRLTLDLSCDRPLATDHKMPPIDGTRLISAHKKTPRILGREPGRSTVFVVPEVYELKEYQIVVGVFTVPASIEIFGAGTVPGSAFRFLRRRLTFAKLHSLVSASNTSGDS